LYLGGTGIDVGILSLAPGLASTLMQLSWGKIIDKTGNSWHIVSLGFIFNAAMSIPIILSEKTWQIIISATIQSFLSSIAGIAITVRLSEILTPAKRGRFMGVYNPIGLIGSIAGTMSTGLLIPLIGYKGTFLGYTLLNLITFALIGNYISTPQDIRIKYLDLLKPAFKQLLSDVRSLPKLLVEGGSYTYWTFGMATRGFGIALLGPAITVFLVNDIQASKPEIGVLNSISFIVRLASAPTLGYFVDKKGAKKFMLTGFLLAMIHTLSLVFTRSVEQLYLIYVLSGVYWAFIQASWFSWQMNLIPHQKGIYAGVLSFVNGLSWAFGPFIGGFLVEYYGINVTAFFSLVLLLLGLIIMIKVPENYEL
jgi:MFS family permease